MFNNIGKKLKGLASFLCWFGIISSAITALILWGQNSYYYRTVGLGFAVLIVGSLASWIGSWTLYALGQIADDVRELKLSNDNTTVRPKYKQAVALLKQNKYEEAKEILEEISSFEDSAVLLQECSYLKAFDLKKNGKLQDAICIFENLDEYKDASDQCKACWYQIGENELKAKRYEKAYEAFNCAYGYRNADEMLNEVHYVEAKALMAKGDKEEAFNIFFCMMDYKDVTVIVESDSEMAEMLQNADNVIDTDD